MDRVFIFDDDRDWGDQMALSLKGFSTQVATNPKDWDQHIASTRWNAIVVDVQILGHTLQGPHMAARSILEFGITAPVIIVSGIIRLDTVRQKYGDVFFDYVHKDDCGDRLLPVVSSACSRDGLERHLRAMLARIASDLDVIDKRFPSGHLGTPAADIAQSASLSTVGDLIDALISGDKHNMDMMGKEVLHIIHATSTRSWP